MPSWIRKIPRTVLVLGVLGFILLLISAFFALARSSTTTTASAQIKDPGAVVVTAPGLFQTLKGTVTVDAQGSADQKVFLAVGRSNDVTGWSQGIDHSVVTGLKTWEDLSVSHVKGEAKSPNPQGSDLWRTSSTRIGSNTVTVNPSAGDVSVLVASDGTKSAPTQITVTWKRFISNPWSAPLAVAGALLICTAVVLSWREGHHA